MRILILIVITFSACFYSNAQSDTIRNSSIQLLVGAVNNRMVDTGLTFNHQPFSGTSFKFFAGYDRRRTKNMLLGSFEINGGKLKMKGEQVSANITNGEIAASYLFKTASYRIFGKKTRLYTGPKFSTAINYVDATEKLDNETLVAIHGFYLHAFQQIQFAKSNFLDVSITLPTVAFSKRLVTDGGLYDPDDENLIDILFDDSEFSFGKMIEFDAAWIKRLGRHTDITFRYRFAYMSNSEFGDFKFYSNEVLAGFKFYFKNE